ncbi:MAG TPA: hypothetical protein VI873_01620, partial [Candidatus Peribacteraceae bacterium]|nr:hypothetical protein [Candidatus Peribacteraceae bacterium]
RTRAAVYDNFPNRSRGSFTPAVGNDFPGWQNGFHDEIIMDSRQRNNTIQYVTYNATHHHLVTTTDHWPWSSLHYQDLLDPMEIWFT